MSAAVCAESAGHSPTAGEVFVLHRHLRSIGRREDSAETAVATCLVWVAAVLMRAAHDVADPQSATALMNDATAVLDSVAAPATPPRLVPPSGVPSPGVPSPGVPPPGVPSPGAPLTNQQLALLRQLQEEASLREIADRMYVSYNTAKSHSRAVYRKLGAASRAEAVLRARELGLV
ncbi:LuxR C-terminal-related transcriptional regulator [Streptomyces flavofungini]|uniref:LuxR C-terminal-related transcriptional regulator n=1 Tax=Streptomyces flavofungini TaxID=68200 RepID=UPI0034DFE5E6